MNPEILDVIHNLIAEDYRLAVLWLELIYEFNQQGPVLVRTAAWRERLCTSHDRLKYSLQRLMELGLVEEVDTNTYVPKFPQRIQPTTAEPKLDIVQHNIETNTAADVETNIASNIVDEMRTILDEFSALFNPA